MNKNKLVVYITIVTFLGGSFYYFLKQKGTSASSLKHTQGEKAKTPVTTDTTHFTRVSSTTYYNEHHGGSSANIKNNGMTAKDTPDYNERAIYTHAKHEKNWQEYKQLRQSLRSRAGQDKGKQIRHIKQFLKNPALLMQAIDSGEYSVNNPMPNPGRRILDMIILEDKFDEARILLTQGARLDDDASEPEYHIAPIIAQQGGLQHMQFIKEYGADLHTTNIFEENTFEIAIKTGKLDMAAFLIEQGVSPRSDPQGLNALDLVLKTRKATSEIVTYLFSLGFTACEEHLEILDAHSKDFSDYDALSALLCENLTENEH